MPNQAAKEFLRNRLNVTAGQAEEYTKAIKQISELVESLSNNKRHPFLPDSELPAFQQQANELCGHLEAQKKAVTDRLTSDEMLNHLNSIFEESTGDALSDQAMKRLEDEGLLRYKSEIPPGYRDAKKNADGDIYRKYGDLIIWKQLIERAKAEKRPCIFVTDDRKDDWWLEQSGKTIGPRPELVEEFISETGSRFWMYSVEKFLQEISRIANVKISEEVLQEVVEVREVAREQSAVSEVSEELVRIRKRTPNAAFLKKLQVSEPLAVIVGDQPLDRTEIVSRLWDYIKKNNLQDRANKRNINADEKLFAIFQKPMVSMFELAALIGKHVQVDNPG